MNRTFASILAYATVTILLGLFANLTCRGASLINFETQQAAFLLESKTDASSTSAFDLEIVLGGKTEASELNLAFVQSESQSQSHYGFFEDMLVVPAGLPVPEPSALSLLALGGMACIFKRRRTAQA